MMIPETSVDVNLFPHETKRFLDLAKSSRKFNCLRFESLWLTDLAIFILQIYKGLLEQIKNISGWK